MTGLIVIVAANVPYVPYSCELDGRLAPNIVVGLKLTQQTAFLT